MQNLGKIFLSLSLLILLSFGRIGESFCQNLSQEYQIKGAYIFNFAQFTDWPSTAFQNSSDPLTIGIVGKDPFGVFIDELVKGEAKSGHPIIIKRFKNLEEIESTHILFVCKDSNLDIGQVNTLVKGKPVLTISDINGYAKVGGVVEFYIEENKIKFIVNVREGEGRQLQFSSKLLRLAKICCK